jgi:ribosomal protein S18 acetylase RimI-like enzyme
MPDLLIRAATRDDLPAVLALYGQPDFNDGRVASLAEAERIFERFASYPDYALYVAEEEARIVGTFCLLVLDNIAHWGMPAGLVESVVVSDEVQGRGVGRAMMREAFRMAEARGCYKVALSSNVRSTGAHAFYESLGFERYGFSFRLDPPFTRDQAA